MKSTFRFFIALTITLAFTSVTKAQSTFDGMHNSIDSVSYAIGLDLGHNLLAQKISLNADALAQGLKDAASNQDKFTQEQVVQILDAFQQRAMEEQQNALGQQQTGGSIEAEKNLAAGIAFLDEKKTAKGVVSHPSGLLYAVIKKGKGKVATLADQVTVHYMGTLIDGTEFDNSYKRGEPATFPLDNLIEAWKIAIPLMKQGAKWTIYCPTELAYGMQAPPSIGPNQALVFDIELVKVVSTNPGK